MQTMFGRHASWGHAVGPAPLAHEYHCAHADYDVVGVQLTLVRQLSDGSRITITCVTSDTVQPKHKAVWLQKFVIELSHEAYTRLRLCYKCIVEVYKT